MKHWEIESGERRSLSRFKQAFGAVCEISGARYKAQTFDINEKGMTVLTAVSLPTAMDYRVFCQMPDGPRACFEVNEVHRMALTRRNKQFLRLGLHLRKRNTETQNFFNELAHLFSKLKPQQKSSPFIRVAPPVPMARGRSQRRVVFQLPVFALVGDDRFRCRTHDLSSWGMGLAVPSTFPGVGVFELVCLEPSGREIPILVQTKNRRGTDKTDDMFRLGLQVIGGQRNYNLLLGQTLMGSAPLE